MVSCLLIILNEVYTIEHRGKLKRGSIRKSAISICWGIFWAYLLINTLCQGDVTQDFEIGVLSTICIFILIKDNVKDTHKLLNVIMIWLEILIYINFISMIIFSNGMYVSPSTGNTENWILGYDNFFEQTFIPAVVIAFAYAYLYKQYIRSALLIVIIHISASITTPGTLIVALAFVDIFLFLGIYKFKKVFSLGHMVFGIIILTVGIVFFDIQTKYGQIIFEILNKDSTFTGRTTIWAYTINAIKESPLFGYGFSDGYARLAKMGYIMKGAFNSHNQFLEFAWEGGFVLMILFAICTFITVIKAKKTQNMKVTQFFSLGISAIFITFIAKAYIQTFPIFVLILWGLMDYTNEIENSAVDNKRYKNNNYERKN